MGYAKMTEQKNKKILVAMSGGVDSSLAASLLKEQGYDLVGVNMRTHKLSAEEIALGPQIKSCCSPTDAKDARSCAEKTELPFYVLDVEEEFRQHVIAPFIDDYLHGRTPNPCVLCNNHVKLGLLMEKATLWGCEQVATGHYARKVFLEDTGRWTLAKAADQNKDQTYYLFGLTQKQLSRLELPLGELTKDQVREMARQAGLPTAEKAESQEICFIPSNDYRSFLRKEFANKKMEMPKGQFLRTDGKVLGKHEGIAFYTVGQRRGLKISGPEPYYVVQIDPVSNNIILGTKNDVLFSGLIARDLNWMGITGIQEPTRAYIQIRHRHKATAGTLYPPDPQTGELKITFDEPADAVSPGQAAVFYNEQQQILGGGWIVHGITDNLLLQ